MTLKSESNYSCPACSLAWLPYSKGARCPACNRELPDNEVTRIISEALQSSSFNKKLYGKFELEYWTARSLGDRYLAWGFKALDLAEAQPDEPPESVALSALMDLDLEEMTPFRAHVLGFLEELIRQYRQAAREHPEDWRALPPPEKPFFGRKIIDDQV